VPSVAAWEDQQEDYITGRVVADWAFLALGSALAVELEAAGDRE